MDLRSLEAHDTLMADRLLLIPSGKDPTNREGRKVAVQGDSGSEPRPYGVVPAPDADRCFSPGV